MANYITVDGGTTNTRISLVVERQIKDTAKYNIGAGCGDKEFIKSVIRDGVRAILEKNSMQEKDIKRILASGMITSETGLCSVEHLVTPCGTEELAKGMYETAIEDVSDIPFVFARGVRTSGTDFSELDMMRGEETELMGISDKTEPDCLYVLPGSHSKLVYTDSKGRIDSFSTELTGELISAVSDSTILKWSVDLKGCEPDEEYLQKGYICAREKGVNAAFFKVRILDKLLGCSRQQVFGFFMGVSLSAEINNILKSDLKKVVICGKRELKEPMALLVRKNSDKVVVTVPDNITENAAAYGVVRLFESKRSDSYDG